MNKVRDTKIDVSKALGIMLIVYGHSGLLFTNYVYLFHVPLFFIISGYFFINNIDLPILLLLKKLFKNLVLPYYLYSLFFLLFHYYFISIGILNPLDSKLEGVSFINDLYIGIKSILFLDQTEVLLSTFWFITILFWINIFFILLFKLFNKNLLIISTAVVLFYCLSGINIRYDIVNLNFNYGNYNVAFTSSLFFLSGIIINKFNLLRIVNLKLAIGSLVSLFLINKIFRPEIDLRINLYPNIFLLVLSSFMGLIIIYYLSGLISKFRIAKGYLDYIGKNTLIILALHFLAFKVITFIQIKIYKMPTELLSNFNLLVVNNYWRLLYLVIGLLIPILIKLSYDYLRKKIVCRYQSL